VIVQLLLKKHDKGKKKKNHAMSHVIREVRIGVTDIFGMIFN